MNKCVNSTLVWILIRLSEHPLVNVLKMHMLPNLSQH